MILNEDCKGLSYCLGQYDREFSVIRVRNSRSRRSSEEVAIHLALFKDELEVGLPH